MIVTGSCHCGEVKFQAEVEPDQMQICHCTDCQVLTGSAFRATVAARPESFKLVRGEPRIYLKTADSGSRRRHAFCGTCGTPVYRMPTDNTPNYSLRIGNLDQKLQLETPVRQIWTKRRLPWVTDLEAVPEIDFQS